jgi:hypothetical protein
MHEPDQNQYEAPKTEFHYSIAGYTVIVYAKDKYWYYKITGISFFDEPIKVGGFIDRRTAIGDAYLKCIKGLR